MYMGKRQEMARKGALVRGLIDDNQYIEALQIPVSYTHLMLPTILRV